METELESESVITEDRQAQLQLLRQLSVSAASDDSFFSASNGSTFTFLSLEQLTPPPLLPPSILQSLLQLFRPLLRPYYHYKRLLFYDVCFFLINAPWLLPALIFWYAPRYLIRSFFALTGVRLCESRIRQTLFFTAGITGLVLLRSIISGGKIASWNTVIPSFLVDNILQRYEPGIDQTCGWAARRLLSRTFASRIPLLHQIRQPSIVPSPG